MDGPSASSGRLEIFYQGLWGTVCHTGFSNVDATVACRSIGYRYRVTTAHFHLPIKSINSIVMVRQYRSSDHCLATFLWLLDNSRKLRNLIKPNFFALIDSCQNATFSFSFQENITWTFPPINILWSKLAILASDHCLATFLTIILYTLQLYTFCLK